MVKTTTRPEINVEMMASWRSMVLESTEVLMSHKMLSLEFLQFRSPFPRLAEGKRCCTSTGPHEGTEREPCTGATCELRTVVSTLHPGERPHAEASTCGW